MNVLVFGVDNSIGTGIIQCLQGRPDRDIIAVDTKNIAQGLYRDNIDSYVADEKNTIPSLLNIADRTDTDLLLPTRVTDVQSILRSRTEFESIGASIGLPDEQLAATLRDKKRLAKRFPDLAPRFIQQAQATSDDFPVVVRRQYVPTEGELTPVTDQRTLKYECDVCKRKDETPVVQEYIEGPYTDEFIIGQLYDSDGNLVVNIPAQIRSKGWGFSGRINSARTVGRECLLKIGQQVASELDVRNSPLTILLKQRDDETYALIDIKPRFWEPLYLTSRAGINAPALLCNILSGENVERQKYTADVLGARNRVFRPVARSEVANMESR